MPSKAPWLTPQGRRCSDLTNRCIRTLGKRLDRQGFFFMCRFTLKKKIFEQSSVSANLIYSHPCGADTLELKQVLCLDGITPLGSSRQDLLSCSLCLCSGRRQNIQRELPSMEVCWGTWKRERLLWIREWKFFLINQPLFQSKVGLFLLLLKSTQKAKERKQKTPKSGESRRSSACL